ncbi:hypothetical protein HMPREF9999_00718 [Alloprevotella sp. oral taxon 473 str. F0040]|nr:hypothetical protein HMPREF9999_00718 [Alloprevotella sp. oral taxon 473 str. F0040]
MSTLIFVSYFLASSHLLLCLQSFCIARHGKVFVSPLRSRIVALGRWFFSSLF